MRINVISEQHEQLLKEAKIGPFSQKVKNMSKVLKKLRKEKEAEGEVEGEGEGLPHLWTRYLMLKKVRTNLSQSI